MTNWRPATSISVKAMALIWQDDALLLWDVKDDSGRVTGMRPLGGTVEFGEPWRDALQREFLEELGARITLLDNYFVMENIYEHHGMTGHEVVFLCHAHFNDNKFYKMDSILIEDAGVSLGTAKWVSLDELSARGLELFPTGLKDRLARVATGGCPGRTYS
jgi:ADP-ribose pyrophosphatase YjhB (NUDIX family)